MEPTTLLTTQSDDPHIPNTLFTNQQTSKEKQLRSKIQALEEKILEFSGFKPFMDIHIYDIPITFKGQNLTIHTTCCGYTNQNVLVLLHGYGANNISFKNIIKELSAKYRVYCIDQLGLGLSSRPKYECKTPKEAADFFADSLEEWRKSMGIEEFYLAGFSLGGHVAAYYCIKYQNRVKKLFMISPAGIGKSNDTRTFQEKIEDLSFFKRQLYKVVDSLWKKNMTFNSLFSSFPFLMKMFFKSSIDKLDMKQEEKEALTGYILSVLELPEGSERCIYLLFEPPDGKGLFPLEDMIIKELKIPIVCFIGVHDWLDMVGPLNIEKKIPGQNFKNILFAHGSHNLLMEYPEHMVHYIGSGLDNDQQDTDVVGYTVPTTTQNN